MKLVRFFFIGLLGAIFTVCSAASSTSQSKPDNNFGAIAQWSQYDSVIVHKDITCAYKNANCEFYKQGKKLFSTPMLSMYTRITPNYILTGNGNSFAAYFFLKQTTLSNIVYSSVEEDVFLFGFTDEHYAFYKSDGSKLTNDLSNIGSMQKKEEFFYVFCNPDNSRLLFTPLGELKYTLSATTWQKLCEYMTEYDNVLRMFEHMYLYDIDLDIFLKNTQNQ